MKKSLILILVAIVAQQGLAQSNIGFFQMRNATPQNMNYNAAVFPESKVFVSLPGISGIDLSVNNSFGLLDIMTPTGDSTLIDIDRFLLSQNDRPYVNVMFGMTDLMVGWRMKSSFMSVFVNERMDATVFYPMKLMNFLWRGNAPFVGEEYIIDDISYDFTLYREIGIGYGRTFSVAGMDLTAGVRMKYLTGSLHSSIQRNLNMSITTAADDYALTLALNDGLIRSSGLNNATSDDPDYMALAFNPQNSGFGMDLGGQLDLTEKLSVGLAVNDLGFIKWAYDAEEVSFSGATLEIAGTTLDDLETFGEALSDSLENIQLDTVMTSFRTSLNSRTFITASYEVTKGGFAQATISNYITQGRLISAIGIGYQQNVGRWLAVSVTGSAAQQKGIDIGAGLMIRGGFFQLYAAADHLLNSTNVPEASGANIKFGINFLFGKPKDLN